MISIWGFMGSGKSTVGQYVSDHYHWSHIDSDEHIEQREGLSIPELFEQYGEHFFRQKETDFLKQLIQQHKRGSLSSPAILTTGGGMPVREKNRKYLKQLGPCVYLHVSFEEIVKRLVDDETRPLWNQAEMKKMKARYEERLPIYRTADHIIHADRLAAAEIAEQLKRLY